MQRKNVVARQWRDQDVGHRRRLDPDDLLDFRRGRPPGPGPDHSAATAMASRLAEAFALPMQRRLASRNPAAAISTSSAWPWSIRKPKGTGVFNSRSDVSYRSR